MNLVVRVGRALAVLALVVFPAAGAARAAPPHVLLVVVDDLGWMDLGCQGNARLHTPRIDALAKQGVRFTNACAASPVCSPTRAALITGQAPARLGITQHGKDGPPFWPQNRRVQPPPAAHVLPLATVTIAERLRAAGYATGFFGKWHLSGDPDPTDPAAGGPAFWPEHQGFDVNVGGCGLGGPPTYFDPYRIPAIRPRKTGEYLTDRLADETVAFLRGNRAKPMFVCLWTYNVHYPFEAPAELVARYRGREGPGLKNPVYGAQVEATDRAVGRVLDEIDRLGIGRDTLVIFTSDNGGSLPHGSNNGPLRGSKGQTFEGGIRVCTIAWWPGRVPAGTATDAITTTMDLLPTFATLAGAKLPAGRKLDGIDVGSVLIGDPETPPRDEFLYFRGFQLQAVRLGPWKLHLERTGEAANGFGKQSLALFNLSADVGEATNLASTHPDIVARLQKIAEATKNDLGLVDVGPGCRPLGRVAYPQPLIHNDGTVRADAVGTAKQFP